MKTTTVNGKTFNKPETLGELATMAKTLGNVEITLPVVTKIATDAKAEPAIVASVLAEIACFGEYDKRERMAERNAKRKADGKKDTGVYGIHYMQLADKVKPLGVTCGEKPLSKKAIDALDDAGKAALPMLDRILQAAKHHKVVVGPMYLSYRFGVDSGGQYTDESFGMVPATAEVFKL